MDNNSIFNIGNIGIESSAKNMSQDDFQKIIYDRLQKLLLKTFNDNYQKQQIKVAYDRYQFACPFCHDSASASFKKRGNFIFKEGPYMNSFKCFNCGTYMPISKFFKTFSIDLPNTASDYLLDHQVKDVSYVPNCHEDFKNSVFNADEMEKYGIDIEQFKQIFNLQTIDSNAKNHGYYYLVKRCQFHWKNFLYDPKNDALVIINLIKNKVISFQIRSIKEGYKGPKYITISLKAIHEKIMQDDVEVPHNLEELSMLFNLYNVDVAKPVLITEGPMDSLLLPNCIAALGASKKINIGIPLYYVYDSDKAGNEHAVKALNAGAHVFMWDKIKTQYGLPERKKWDINDFFIWCNENKIQYPRLWRDYFTNDSLDMLDI